MTAIGSFDRLSWRMDPSISYSDWKIEIRRTSSSSDVNHYHVHRNVLAVGPFHSEYFAAQFKLETREQQDCTSKIELDDATADVFPLLLDFLYNGDDTIPLLSAASAAALYSLSEYFDTPKLRTTMEDFYRQAVTMDSLVDFISNAKEHHADTLLNICIEKSVVRLLEMDPKKTARTLEPDMLLKMLQSNQESGNRRYGFHASKLVAECCRHNAKVLSREVFDQLTDMLILPYMESKAAIFLLSIDAGFPTAPSAGHDLTCLQKRCTQSIAEKWKFLRKELKNDEELNEAFAKVPSHILIDILMNSTEQMNVALSDTDEELEETESPTEAPPRILVRRSGNPEVNGIYRRDGLFQGIAMYTRRASWGGENCLFSMFQCLVGSNIKRWFISVIPPNGRPGTNKDIDFFSALVTDECRVIPPTTGWRRSSDGENPPPSLLY